MEKVEIEKYKDIALRRIWWVIIPLLLSILVGIGLTLTLPKTYRASSLILIQAQKVPGTYVREIVASDIENRVRTITQQVTSRTNLENIIKEFNLYSGPGRHMFMEEKVEDLRKRISVEVSQTGRSEPTAFQIFFTGTQPKQVADVANALTSYFIDENLRFREDQALGTAEFLRDELETIRRKLLDKEEELKRYREQHMGGLPQQLETNLRILERIQDQIGTNQENLRQAENRKLLIQQQLAEAKKMKESPAPPPAITGQEPEDSLEQLRALLASLQARYTEQHPDVIRLKKKISQLEAEDRSGSRGNRDAPKDLAFVQAERNLVNQLREIDLQIKNLKAEAAQLNAQIKSYEALVENTPKREQELISLNRDYNNLRQTYDSLLNRKLEAELAVSMERKQKGEQFRILDSAKVPFKPFKPDIERMLLMCVVLGLALGCGLAYVREIMDTSFRDPEDIEEALKVPVLTSLPFALNAGELRRIKTKKILTALGVGLGFIVAAVLLVASIKGVDATMGFIKTVMSNILGT